jgi:hypothetical protein
MWLSIEKEKREWHKIQKRVAVGRRAGQVLGRD